jgi:hypothetical protein
MTSTLFVTHILGDDDAALRHNLQRHRHKTGGGLTMSPYYATHAGLLRYVAEEFTALSGQDAEHGDKLALYADILKHMIDELSQRAPVEPVAAE